MFYVDFLFFFQMRIRSRSLREMAPCREVAIARWNVIGQELVGQRRGEAAITALMGRYQEMMVR